MIQPALSRKPPAASVSIGRGLWLALALWMGLVAVGFAQLLQYKGTAGTTAAAAAIGPVTFPESSILARSPQGQTLLMFVHPHCACSQASLRELSNILAECPELRPVQIVIPLPAAAPAGWQNGKNARQAEQLAEQLVGVRVIWDHDEQLTRQFGVQTSGHVLLFDAAGRRVFSGGITALRGHEGWNAGRGAVIAHHQQLPGACRTTPVFGCSLLSDSRAGESP